MKTKKRKKKIPASSRAGGRRAGGAPDGGGDGDSVQVGRRSSGAAVELRKVSRAAAELGQEQSEENGSGLVNVLNDLVPVGVTNRD